MKSIYKFCESLLGACLALWLVTTSALAQQANFVSLSGDSESNTNTAGLWFEYQRPGTRDWFTELSEPESPLTRSTLALDQVFSSHTIHFGMANGVRQQHGQLGLSLASVSLSGFSGEGDTISSIFHPYSAVADFHFHGGVRHDYHYSGYRFDYQIGAANSIGLTRVAIDAAGLSQRTVDEVAWQGKSVDFSLAQVRTAGIKSGIAMTFGAKLGNVHLQVQKMNASNAAQFTKYSIVGNTLKGKELGLHFEQRKNPLFTDNNDNRILLSLGFKFGGQQPMYATETASGSEEKPKKSKTGPILAGAGAVGAAIALSSGGGDGADSQPRFASQNDSARQVLNSINPTSVSENREYGGYVYRHADGSFSSTAPIKGQAASVALPDPRSVGPRGATTTASYHTHAATDSRFVNEEFSPQDILSDNLFGLDGYLATPKGQFKYHNVRARRIVTLGGSGTIATSQ